MTVAFRATTEDDREALLAFSTREPVAWTGADRYRAEAVTRNHRPEWSWLAVRDGRPVARAIWWGGADAAAPSTLDDLLVAPDVADDERVAIAAGLIAAGGSAFGVLPEWIVDVAVDWHDDPEAVAALSWRTAAARSAGLGRSTERVSVAWTPDRGVPASSSLRFRGGKDDEFGDTDAPGVRACRLRGDKAPDRVRTLTRASPSRRPRGIRRTEG